jgi:hypothetical protein
MKHELIAETDRQRKLMLLENYPLRLAKAKGWRINCVSGIALITAYNEPQDFELRPGGVFVVPNNGLTLMEGIGHCYVTAEAPCPDLHPLFRWLQVRGRVLLQQRLSGFRVFEAMLDPKRSRH